MTYIFSDIKNPYNIHRTYIVYAYLRNDKNDNKTIFYTT